MRFPRVVAVQKLQTGLLVTALVAVFLTGVLVVNLTRNLRSVVIGETNKALANAVSELRDAGRRWESAHKDRPLPRDFVDQELRPISYEVLRSYPDVEGGYLLNEEVIGHSFPTYTEPGSRLLQPPLEHEAVLAALAESRRTGRVASRVVQDQNDLVLVSALGISDRGLSAWSLRRIFNFSNSRELSNRLLLVAAMVVSLIAIGTVLRLSFRLQRGFEIIQAGLERLRTDPHYRLPDQDHELRTIVQAINTMAESRQTLEADLRREDRLRVMGRVVAGIAHEIRNPLNSIRLTIRVLAKRLKGQATAEEPIALVTNEIDRLDSLLKSLLVFHAEEPEPEKERRQPLQPLLERTLALVKPHAEENRVTFRVTVVSDCRAVVDADHLQQALMNLLLNAIDASGHHGEVDVVMRVVDGYVEIDIEDSGPGLTPEQRERIFEAFYTTKVGGTGLGLAVTKTLLEKMGAQIESGKGYRGARFRIRLPVGKEA